MKNILLIILSVIAISSYNMNYAYPTSLRSLKGAATINLTNATNTLQVTNIHGIVYYGKTAIVNGTADNLTIPAGGSAVKVTGYATVCEGVSTFTALRYALGNLRELTFTAKCTVRDTGTGEKMEIVKENVSLATFMK